MCYELIGTERSATHGTGDVGERVNMAKKPIVMEDASDAVVPTASHTPPPLRDVRSVSPDRGKVQSSV